MKRALLGLCLPLVAAAQTPPPIMNIAPHAKAAPAAMSQRVLLTWRPQAQCDGVALDAAAFRQPSVGMIWGAMTSLKPVEYRFDIGGDGRTVGIRRDGGDYVPFTDDIGPALSASRFAAGAPRTGCTVRFVPQQAPLATAALEDLAAYSLAPTAGALPREAWDRIYAAGSCLRAPRARPLTQVYPDFDKIEGTRGVRDWSMVGYDTDAAGRPTNVRIVYGTHHAGLDAAAVKALRESRYSGGARAGCLYPYWHAPEKLVARQSRTKPGFARPRPRAPNGATG
jgi:hypothetical protein